MGGVACGGVARLNLAATDIRQSIQEVEIIFVIPPAFGHRIMAQACAPYVQDGQTIVVMPGSGGSLEFAKIFKGKKVKKEITFAETCTLPYGARLKGPGHVSVLIHAVTLPTGVFPSKQAKDVIPKSKQFYPV